MISRSMPSGSSTARIRRRTSTTVLGSLKTGTMTDSLRIFGGVRSSSSTGALLQVPGVRTLESFAQLDFRFPAEELLDTGDVGLTSRRITDGERLEHDVRFGAGDVAHDFGELEHRVLDGVPDVDRLDDFRIEKGEDAAHLVFDEAERTCLRSPAVDRERLTGDGLHQKIRDDASVGRTQTRTVGVEDAHDASREIVETVVGHRERLGETLGFVVHGAW